MPAPGLPIAECVLCVDKREPRAGIVPTAGARHASAERRPVRLAVWLSSDRTGQRRASVETSGARPRLARAGRLVPGLCRDTGSVAVCRRSARADGERRRIDDDLTLRLRDASGAALADAQAIGAIVNVNSDPLSRAWLARLGRTVAGHMLKAVAERLNGQTAGTQVTIAGTPLTAGAAAAAADRAEMMQALDEWLQNGQAAQPLRTMGFRELLAGSSFTALATSEQQHEAGEHDGGRWTVCVGGGWTRFAGTDDGLSLDGEVITGTVGAGLRAGPAAGRPGGGAQRRGRHVRARLGALG